MSKKINVTSGGISPQQLIDDIRKPLQPAIIWVDLAIETLEDDPANVAELARKLKNAKSDLLRLRDVVSTSSKRLKSSPA